LLGKAAQLEVIEKVKNTLDVSIAQAVEIMLRGWQMTFLGSCPFRWSAKNRCPWDLGFLIFLAIRNIALSPRREVVLLFKVTTKWSE
jgi:hypothetical protein